MTSVTATTAPESSALIPVFTGNIGGVPMPVCKATDLHAFLQVVSKFADWISNRIEKYGFVENHDFSIASKNLEAKRGGHNRKDYLLCLDMAKELSMVENNDKGREARRYFIAMERKALEAAGQVVPTGRIDTLTPSEQQTLSEIVKSKVAHLSGPQQGKGLAEIWSRLHNKFRVAKYSQIPRTELAEAIMYVASLDLRGVPNAEKKPALCTQEQRSKLSRRALDAGEMAHTTKCLAWAINDRVRREMGVKSMLDLPASSFQSAMDLIGKLERYAFQLKSRVIDIEKQFCLLVIRDGSPDSLAEFEALFANERQEMLAKFVAQNHAPVTPLPAPTA